MELEIKGLDELQRKFAAMPEQLKREMETATQQAMYFIHGSVPPYPPPPQDSSYIRTGTLGREINTEVRSIGSDVVGVIGSPTVYSPWVISDQAVGGRGPQAWMHRGRWWTLQGVVLKARDQVVKIYEAAIEKLLKR